MSKVTMQEVETAERNLSAFVADHAEHIEFIGYTKDGFKSQCVSTFECRLFGVEFLLHRRAYDGACWFSGDGFEFGGSPKFARDAFNKCEPIYEEGRVSKAIEQAKIKLALMAGEKRFNEYVLSLQEHSQ